MYEPQADQVVDIEAECRHVAEFLSTRWVWLGTPQRSKPGPLDNFEPVARFIADRAQNEWKGWFDALLVGKPLWGMSMQMPRDLKLAPGGSRAWGQSMYWNVTELESVLRREWDFGRASGRVRDDAVREWPDLLRVAPIDRAAETNADRAAFQGMDSATGGTADLPLALSPRWVEHNKTEQGRSIATSLVGAIYGHFLAVTQHNNTVLMRRELAEIERQLSEPAQGAFTPNLQHPVLAALNELAQTEMNEGPFDTTKVSREARVREALSPLLFEAAAPRPAEPRYARTVRP